MGDDEYNLRFFNKLSRIKSRQLANVIYFSLDLFFQNKCISILTFYKRILVGKILIYCAFLVIMHNIILKECYMANKKKVKKIKKYINMFLKQLDEEQIVNLKKSFEKTFTEIEKQVKAKKVR